MKYTRFILTRVASSLFISSIKLEAMETMRRTFSRRIGIRGLSKPQMFLANSENLTNNRLENLITNPPRLPYQIDSVSHHNLTNSVWKKKTDTTHKLSKRRAIRLERHELRQNSKTWIRRLVESSLINQNKTYNNLQDTKSKNNTLEQINHLGFMNKLLNNSRIICIGPLNTSSGADILSSLIAQTK